MCLLDQTIQSIKSNQPIQFKDMKFNNASFNAYDSISPSRSNKNSHKQNQNESINSAYQQRLKQSISTRQHTQKASSDNLYLLKLQSKILEMQKKIDHQKYQIDTLTLETQNFMSLCDKQKIELNNFNVEMLRQEYQEQIHELIQEKEKVTELIYSLTEQYRQAQLEQQNQLQQMKARNVELANKIQQALDKKQKILTDIAQVDRKHHQNQDIIQEQQQKIDQLRNIERKLIIALRQIEALDKKQ